MTALRWLGYAAAVVAFELLVACLVGRWLARRAYVPERLDRQQPAVRLVWPARESDALDERGELLDEDGRVILRRDGGLARDDDGEPWTPFRVQ